MKHAKRDLKQTLGLVTALVKLANALLRLLQTLF
jgi:hypothetical protein